VDLLLPFVVFVIHREVIVRNGIWMIAVIAAMGGGW
jgi:hypothetical protein